MAEETVSGAAGAGVGTGKESTTGGGKAKRGRGPTVARWQVVVGPCEILPDKYTSDTAALRAIERDKIENAIGLFRPLAVESKVTARLV